VQTVNQVVNALALLVPMGLL